MGRHRRPAETRWLAAGYRPPRSRAAAPRPGDRRRPPARHRRRYLTGLAALVLAAAAACSGSGPAPAPAAVSTDSGAQGLNPGSGPPHRGGTLKLLGIGDVDYMDYNISYYAIGYLGQRMWARGLYAYPAVPGQTTTPAPDLATAAPAVSNGGLTYAVTIRGGVSWNTTPATPVTGAGALLGLKRACNPVQPFGGLPDFESLIKGYAAFCAGFAKVHPTVAGIKAYIDTHSISGVTVAGQVITYHLTQPASYFADELTLPPFSPAPPASLDYLPASAASQQHTLSDGPYEVQSYVPAKSIVFVRNPAWSAATDPIRKAYVSQIDVTETGTQTTNQQILATNSAAGGAEWDSFPPAAAELGLVAQMTAGGHDLNLGPQYSMNPYLIFNLASPHNGGALAKVAVRRALSYGIDRAHLIQDANGPVISPALTHVLPNGVNGAQDVPAGYNLYPYDPAKARRMLTAAGYPDGLTLKLLYRPASSLSLRMFQTLQSDLAKIGVKVTGVGVPDADFYTKYLEVPSAAQRGVWDLSLASWGPDWYGDAATSFLKPLFSGPSSYPPSGSDFGFYNDPATTSLINRAAAQASPAAAARLWARADQAVMADAAFYPIAQPLLALYHASYVHNVVYVPAFEAIDPTNVWLSAPGGA
jgi:peptide/nickel transport system substrate-binding protein